MSRKVFVNVTVKIIINQDDDVETGNIIDEMDYSFTDNTGNAEILDSEIIDYEVIDSK